MADNTRKTSNIIHTVDDLKTDVENNSQEIQNNTDAINNLTIPKAANDGKIKLNSGKGIDVTGTDATANQSKDTSWSVAVDNTVALKSDIPAPVIPGDGAISLTQGDGVTVSGADATANQTGNTGWTVKTDNSYLNNNLNFAKPDQIPTNYVKDIQSGNILTLTVDEEDGVYTLTALGASGGGAGNIIFEEGEGIDITSEIVDVDGEEYTKYTIKADKQWFEENLAIPEKTSDLTNDGDDGINPFITTADIPAIPAIPEKTSDLTNDGDDGVNPFITAADIPEIPAGTLPISSEDQTVTIDGENNKVSVYGNSGLPDITPVTLEIKTTTDGSGWSTEDAWGKLGFWNDDKSSGGAKEHAFIDCVAMTQTGGQSNMRFGTLDDVWMTMKASGFINFTPQRGNANTPSNGDLYYDSRYELFRYWDGEQWRDINPSGSGNGYFFNSRGDAVCPGVGITDESPVIPVNIGTKYSNNDYMLNDGAIYTITLGTTSTGSVASSKYVVRKVSGVFTAEIMSSNNLVSNVPIISVRPTTQIDPDTGEPYEGRDELVLWDNHAGNYNHTWCVEGMFTGSVQQQFSVSNPWYTIGAAIYQNDNTSYVCLDAINSKDQAIQDVAWTYSSGSFVGKWGDPGDTGSLTRVQFNTWNTNAVNAMGSRPDGTYGRWYERPRLNMKLTNAVTNTKFESATNAYDGNFYSFQGDPATWQGGLIQAVEWDGEGTNAENVTKIRMSARDKNEKDMCHSRTYVSPAYLEDSKNISGNDWMQIYIPQDDGSNKAAAYMVTSGEYVSPSADDSPDSQPYYEYGVKWYGSGTSAGTDFNGGKDGVAYKIQFFRNMTGMVISENGNTQLTRLSLDFNHADGSFYRDCTARVSGERQGSTGEIRLCGYSQVNAAIGLHKNYECGYYGFNVYAEQELAAAFNKTGLNVNGTLTTTLLTISTASSTLVVLESSTLSSQVKCISASGTTWHGINNGTWAVDYYPTGTTTYTEGLRLDLSDGRVTSKGGIGTDTITTKNAATGDTNIQLSGSKVGIGYQTGLPGWDASLLVRAQDNKSGQTNPDDDETSWTEHPGLIIDSRNPNRLINNQWTAQGTTTITTVPPNSDYGYPVSVYRSSGSYGGDHVFAAGGLSGCPTKNEYSFWIDRSGNLYANPDYEPSSNNSLVTKKWVIDNAGGGGGGVSGVSKIIGGTNITVSPLGGTGSVTVNADLSNIDVGVTKIIGGDNVTVSPADGTGNVIINATSSAGGADSLVDLDDVVVTDPKGNEVLTYDITSGKWINKAPPSGGGGGGIIDGGQVPGTGSTFIWYDTKYSYIRQLDGEYVGSAQPFEQPKNMVAYDGVFSDGTFWTLDGVNLRVDPNAVTSSRYVGKFDCRNIGFSQSFQGRVIAGNYGYWFGKYFSQDMKQWGDQTSINPNASLVCQQKQRPLTFFLPNNAGEINQYISGNWQTGYVTASEWNNIFPGYNPNYPWSANQFSGQETAMALESTLNVRDFKIYCLDIDTEDIVWGDNDASTRSANSQVIKNATTYIPSLDGCTTGFFSERLQQWFFAKEGTVYISNTSSLKGGFTTKTLPRTNGWDRCYDDGSAIVFARTGTGNSATVFSVDGGQEWKVSISLVNRDYDNFAGTNGRAMATYEEEDRVPGFVPDPADPSGEGVIPSTSYEWRYAVSGVPDPNPAEASTRNVKLTHPVSIASARAIEAQTQEDANAVFTEEIQRRSPVLTLTQAEYDAIPADEIEDETLYLITS